MKFDLPKIGDHLMIPVVPIPENFTKIRIRLSNPLKKHKRESLPPQKVTVASASLSPHVCFCAFATLKMRMEK